MKKWKITSIDDLVEIIEVPLSLVLDNQIGWDEYYEKKIELPKKGGVREIYVVDKNSYLYGIQINFRRRFLSNIMISDRAYGFVKKENYYSFLREHVNISGNNNFLRIDIKDFFGSINQDHIANVFDFYVEGEDKQVLIDTIKRIVLHNGKLVQGTPVAPVVSNIVFRPLDIRIEKYCNKQNVTYSRYADDLLFSAENETVLSHRFVRTIERILSSQGFYINYTKLKKCRNSLAINGFVVDKSVRLSRKKLSSINGMLFYLENHKYKDEEAWLTSFNQEMKRFRHKTLNNQMEIVFYLAGYRAFLIDAKKVSDDFSFSMHCDHLIHRIEKCIDRLG